MPKTKLPKRELEVCARLKWARENLGFTQTYCAGQLGIERTTLKNYETGISPLRYDLALRFCHQFIISEEWLALGKTPSLVQAASKHGLKMGDTSDLDAIFFRQSMDMIAEQFINRIPRGKSFAEAFDGFLAVRYAELALEFFHVPRIIFMEGDPPERFVHVISAYTERWLKLLGNEALRFNNRPGEVQEDFTRNLLSLGGGLFKKYIALGKDMDRFFARKNKAKSSGTNKLVLN